LRKKNRNHNLGWRVCGSRQAGLTLLELLIAMGLGLFLVAGLIQVLLANRVAFNVQENMSRIQEDGRFVTTVMNKAVSMAGYREDSTVAASTQFSTYTIPSTPALPPPITFNGAQVVRGTDDNGTGTTDEIQDGTDTVAVRFRGSTDNTTRDCHGTVIASGTIAINRFYVDEDTLYCRSDIYNPATGAVLSAANPKQPLINNVEDMQVLYGMSTSGGTNDIAAECYIDASTTLGSGSDCTTLNYDQVVSVRISLLLKSEDDNLTPDRSAQTYTFNGAIATAADSRLYRTLTTTIAIRNKIL